MAKMGTLEVDLEDEDQDDDDGEEHQGSPDVDHRLFRKLKDRPRRVVPLAFTVPDDIPPRNLSGHCLAWTREAMAAFATIRRAARDADPENLKNFPYAYLRGAMEVSLPSAIRLEPDMGLSRAIPDGSGRPGPADMQPFAYLEGASANEVKKALHIQLANWISNNLIPQYAQPGHVEKRLTDRVIELAGAGDLVEVRAFSSRVMPWHWESKTGTTQKPDFHAYQALADIAAKSLAGRELFQGAGPMRRMISASGGSNSAELVTAPIKIGESGLLSLVVTLRVETVPALHQPLLILDVSKRRWLDNIDADAFDRSRISGAVFSEAHPDRAFSFSVNRRSKSRGGGWHVDNAFEAIRRTLGLPLKPTEASAILRGDANTPTAKAFLVYRSGVSEDRHAILAGVPEVDKLEAFTGAARILSDLGLRPFEAMTPVNATHGKAHESSARMIDASTLLGAMLEAADHGFHEGTRFTRGYLQELSQARIDELMLQQFRIGLPRVAGVSRLLQEVPPSKAAKQSDDLAKLIEANHEARRRMYGDDPPRLVLFHEDGPKGQSDLRLLEAAVRCLWGDIPIISNRLPAGTHGPTMDLDSKLPNGKNAPAAERSRRRIEAWRGVSDQIRKSGKRHLGLVMASKIYRDPANGNKPKHDDPVNKPSTRRALAGAGATVQFLQPPEATRNGEVKLADFLVRVQSAMKDLVSAHWGRIDTVASAVEACFSDPERRPREVIGITIVRKQAGRANSIGRSFLPVAIRLDVATGRCDLRCAYESQSGSYASSPWEHLPEALSRIARLSPVKLAEDERERKSRFMRFVEEVIGASVEEGSQPVVLIDSSNAAKLWPWLADSRMNAEDITIGDRQWMQQEWEGARIIRIRQGLTPSIVVDSWVDLAETSVDDARPCDGIAADVSIPVTTAPGGGLFRLSGGARSGCVAYLSVGRKALHKNKRGLSCYRHATLHGKRMAKVDGKFTQLDPARNAAGRGILGLIRRERYIDQWPSPRPIEVVVTLRQEGDSPDRLAEFVERLRYGFGHYREWVSLPAPLFFERVVRDYISHFELEEAENTESDESAVDA
ncbi:RNaseH domain-containing protein [Sorangium sp. So ce216]